MQPVWQERWDSNPLSTHKLLIDAQLMHLALQLGDTVPPTTLIVHSRDQSNN